MSEDELKHILKVVRDEVVELEKQQILSETEFYRGDSFQVLVNRPEEALRAALIVKTAVNKMVTDKSLGKRSKKMHDVAVSIGLGEVSEKSGANTQNARPYILSGRGLDLLKEKKLTLGLFSGDKENDITYRTIFEFYHWIMKQWSVSSAELVYHKLQNKTEQQIAPLLGISQSAVNQRSRAACWNGLEQLLSHYKEIGVTKYG